MRNRRRAGVECLRTARAEVVEDVQFLRRQTVGGRSACVVVRWPQAAQTQSPRSRFCRQRHMRVSVVKRQRHQP